MTKPFHAQLNAQHQAFKRLEDEYSESTAVTLTQRSLQRNGIDTTEEEVRGWHRINDAAISGQLDIAGEQDRAECMAREAADQLLDRMTTPSSAMVDDDDLDDDDRQDEAEDDDEGPDSLMDLYGTDNEEDASEAAYDDVLKIIERGD